MKTFLFTIITLCISTLSYAQEITGRITDSIDAQPLAGATIVQLQTSNGTTTNSNGYFSLKLDEDAGPTIRISFIGYETQEITVVGDAELNIQLKRENSLLSNLTVISSRASKTDPVTQTTVPAVQIQENYAGQDPSIVLERNIPSVVSFSDAGTDIGNYVQFRLRGMDQTRINTTLNGVPLNDMIDQGVFFSNFSDFANSMQSIQVQRGVGLSANGTASYAGSVNFESVNLEGEGPEVGIDLTGGSFNTLRTAGEVKSGRLSNDLAVYSRFTRTTSDGYKFNSASDSYSFFFSGGYLGDSHVLKVNAFAGKTQNDQSYLPVLRTDIENEPRTNYNSPNDTDDFEQELLQLQYTGLISDDLILNSSVYYGGSRGVFPFGLSPTSQLLYGLENDHYGFMGDLSYKTGDFSIKGGVHAYTFLRENINSTAPNTSNPDYQDETTKNEFSSFLRLNYATGKLNLFGDLQLRNVELNFDTDQIQSFGGSVPAGGLNSSRNWLFLNPRFGARYSLSETSSVYASVGATGREPTRTDILQGDGSSINEFNFVSAQDEDIVVAEHVIDYELGYNFSKAGLQADINLFWMDFRNEISLVGALAANSYIPLRQNINESYRRGVEWVIDYAIGNQWDLNFNGAWMQTNVDRFVNGTGEVFTNVEHIFAPDWNLNASLRYKPVDKIGIWLRGRYLSESFMELSNDEDFTLPEVFLLDAQLDVELTEQLRLSFFLNNVFDELYFTDGAPVDTDFDGAVDGPGFRVQPPRNALVQLRVKI